MFQPPGGREKLKSCGAEYGPGVGVEGGEGPYLPCYHYSSYSCQIREPGNSQVVERAVEGCRVEKQPLHLDLRVLMQTCLVRQLKPFLDWDSLDHYASDIGNLRIGNL